jgi:hypothetical protein
LFRLSCCFTGGWQTAISSDSMRASVALWNLVSAAASGSGVAPVGPATVGM